MKNFNISVPQITWLEEHPQGIILKVYIQPNSNKNKIIGPHGVPSRLKIKITVPPIDGKANAAIQKFLATILNVSLKELSIVRGETSRNKDILCKNLIFKEVLTLINCAIEVC